MASSRLFQLHNYTIHGSSGASLPRSAARVALSSLILQTSPPLHSPSSLRYCSHCYCSSDVPVAEVAEKHSNKVHLSSPELVAMEYADLNLSYKLDLGHVRIRQHVNPLSSSFSVPTQAPDWNQVFSDPTLPLMVDIGCGSGRLLLWLAKQNPGVRNYLGLEIRQKLVKRAEVWVKDLALDNIHFLFANATISFKHLVTSYPGPLMFVSILFPDPHFKKRHHKRRVLQKPLVGAIVETMMPGGQVSEPPIRPMALPDPSDTRFTDRLTDLENHMEQTNRDLYARLDQHNRDLKDLKYTFSRLEDCLREMDAKLSLLTKEDSGEISNPTSIVAEGAISKSAIGVAEEARTTLVEVEDVADLKVNENDSNKKESSNNDEVAADANQIVEAVAEEGTRGQYVKEMKPSTKQILLTDLEFQEQSMFPCYLTRNLVTFQALFSVRKTLQTSTALATSRILPLFVADRTHNSGVSRVSLILGPRFDSLLESLGEKPSPQNHSLFKLQASDPPSTFAANTSLFVFSMFTASSPSPTFLTPLGAFLSTYYLDSVSNILHEHIFSGYFTLVYLWQVAFGTEIETLSLDRCIIILSNSINKNSMTIAKVFWGGMEISDVEGLGSCFGSLPSMLITPSLAVCVSMLEDLHQVWSEFMSIKPKKLIRQFNFALVVDVEDVNIVCYESSWDEHKKKVERLFGFSYLVAYKSGVFVEDLGYIAGYYLIEHSYAARMFYFFESCNSNQNPFVLWETGGPGCSSELAMSYENDPFKIANMFLLWIDYGWDWVPNLLYGDQLNGNGFSYNTANDLDTGYDEVGVGNDLYDFMQAFFAEYYIPVLTAQLHKGNKAKEGSHINMKDYCGVLGILLPIAFVFYLFFLLNEELKANFVGALQVVMGFGFLLGFSESFPPVFALRNSKQGPPIKNGLPNSVFVFFYVDGLWAFQASILKASAMGVIWAYIECDNVSTH